MEQDPGSFITPDPYIFLKVKSAYSVFLNRNPPNSLEPGLQRQPTGLKNRPSLDRILEPTRLTSTKSSGHHPKFICVASLALELLAPSNLLKKTQARLVIGEGPIKFTEVFWVFHTS